ncbi:MAG: hypothetical protein V2B13_13040 [Pseudomonadota bacterium]
MKGIKLFQGIGSCIVIAFVLSILFSPAPVFAQKKNKLKPGEGTISDSKGNTSKIKTTDKTTTITTKANDGSGRTKITKTNKDGSGTQTIQNKDGSTTVKTKDSSGKVTTKVIPKP